MNMFAFASGRFMAQSLGVGFVKAVVGGMAGAAMKRTEVF